MPSKPCSPRLTHHHQRPDQYKQSPRGPTRNRISGKAGHASSIHTSWLRCPALNQPDTITRNRTVDPGLAKLLLGMTTDDQVPPAVKLQAIKDALDRAGLSPKQALDISHTLTPFEELLGKMSRLPDPGPAKPSIIIDGKVVWDNRFGDDPPSDIVDAEIVDEDPYADNPLQVDGVVHCQRCDYVFADLDALHAAGLTKYARLCADCREEIRAEMAEERELDAEIDAPTGSRPPLDPLQTRRGRPTEPAPQPDRTPGRNPRYPRVDPRY